MLTLPLAPVRPAVATAFLGILAALTLGAPACALPGVSAIGFDEDAQGQFDKTLSVSAPANLTISTGSGSIRANQGGDGSIHVIGRIHVGYRERNDSDAMARV